MGSDTIALYVEGHMEAVGTTTEPITFTSVADTGPNEWYGIAFNGGTGHLNHTVVRYGAVEGIGISGLPDDGPISIENSVLQDILGYPLVVLTGDLHRLQLNNVSASGNMVNRVLIHANDYNDNKLTRDAELTAVPGMDGYEFTQYGLEVPLGITLTLDPGVVLMGDVLGSVRVAGHLEAVGTTTEPITFTSVADTGVGEWRGIAFVGGNGHLNHAIVRYAGQFGESIIIDGTSGDGTVLIENSVIQDNLGYPMTVRPENLHRLQMSNVTFRGNSQNRVLITYKSYSDSLVEDATLTAQTGLEGYELADSSNPLIVPTGITLTLEPGVTLLMPDWYDLVEVYGHLEAVGTAVSPITFTANTGLGMSERVPFHIEGSAHLDHILTGGNLNIGVWEANGGSVLIENSTLSGSTFYPLFVGNNALHRLQMTNVTFTDNITNRVLIEPRATNNGALAGSARLTSQPGLEGYQIMPILPESVPNLVVPSGLTLTVDPGVTLMGVNSGNLVVEGHLMAQGTAVSPVTFTSITDTLPGEWGGLVISGTASLDHAVVRNGQHNLDVLDAAGVVSVANSEIDQASEVGLNIAGGQVTTVCTTFTNNNGGAIYVAGSPDVTVFTSSISGNGSGVNNEGSTAVDARYNWWGDVSGPGGDGPGNGDAIWGNVVYDPWLNEPTCTLTPHQLFLPVIIGP